MMIAIISPDEVETHLPQLSAVLHDCVAGGASVSFMSPFSQDQALAYFEKVGQSVRGGDTVLFGAFLDGRLVGTVQLGLDGPCNQRHRGDVRKLLVHRAARGRGVGEALMRALEPEAVRRGLCLLTLDTASDAAERLYERLGWTRTGVIPNYAKLPDGRFCDTTIFWKALG